jgi:hypothetical protein
MHTRETDTEVMSNDHSFVLYFMDSFPFISLHLQSNLSICSDSALSSSTYRRNVEREEREEKEKDRQF